jgi:hypothetical protein
MACRAIQIPGDIWIMRNFLMAIFLTVGSLATADADGTLFERVRTRAGLARQSPCGYEHLFASGSASVPCGRTAGTVLHVCGGHPKLAAKMQSGVWKGKTFTPCDIRNRWLLGVTAINTAWRIDTSRVDGQPCLVMEYPAGTPVFGGLRDEVREVAPGTWLGRCTDSTTGELKNWFLLQQR